MQDTRLDAATRSDGARGPVLVPLDGSRLAERALAWGMRLAARRQAPLLLARAVPPAPPTVAPSPATVSLIEQIVEEERQTATTYIEEKASESRAAAPGLDVRTAVRVGDAAVVLLALEPDEDVRLVVMSTHGRSGLRRWLRGSIAETVLRHGSAPVLLIRPWDDPRRQPHRRVACAPGAAERRRAARRRPGAGRRHHRPPPGGAHPAGPAAHRKRSP